MSRAKQVRLGSLAALALALSVAAALALGHSQAGPSFAGDEGTVAADCDASTPALDTDCQYDFGEVFQAGFFVVAPPPSGYFTIQSKMDWDNSIIMWQPAASAADEAVWPDCSIAARDPEPPGEGTDPPLVFSCTPLPPLGSGKMTTGNLLVFEFQCLTEAPPDLSPPGTLPSTSFALVDPGAPGGTWFGDSVGNIITPTIDPTSSTITCGTPPPEPTPTEGPPGPTPTEGPPGPTPTEGAPQPTATGEELPDQLPSVGAGGASGSGPGAGTWALFGVLIAAAGSGLGVVGWRYARSR